MRYRKLVKLTLVTIVSLTVFCGCKEKILHNLTERDANSVISALAKGNLEAEKLSEGSGWSIEVDHNQMLQALEVLEESRMLNRLIDRAGQETEQSSSFVQSREEKQWYIEKQVSASLEDTLLRLPGVLEARVHLFIFPENRLEIRQTKDLRTGSVLLVVDSGYMANDEQVKSLVSGASGVSQNQISIVVTPAFIGSEKENIDIEDGQFNQDRQKSLNDDASLGWLESEIALHCKDISMLGVFGVVTGIACLGFVCLRRRSKIVNVNESSPSLLRPVSNSLFN